MNQTIRTVDNLGFEIDERYAQDQKDLDTSFLKESRTIPSQTSILATTPTSKTPEEILFGPMGNQSIALFTPPPEYTSLRKSLFAQELVPSLGNSQRFDTLFLEKIKAYGAQVQTQYPQDQKQIQQEKKTLLNFGQKLTSLSQLFLAIIGARGQYSRG